MKIRNEATEWIGWFFCETAFKVDGWATDHVEWDDERDCYTGVVGWIAHAIFSVTYPVGCKFYGFYVEEGE